MSCHVTSCHLTSCHVFSRLVISRHVISCHVMIYSRILLPNLSSEPSKFFYYGGGVATTRFSKPWPCAGIRLGATLSLWRRAHCERARTFLSRSRGRLRGSGLRHVAGVPRVCRGAVPWGLGPGRVLYTHGQRAFRVAGCGDRACWEVCRGHVAWQAWGMVRPGHRFAWQAAGIVRAGKCVAGCWRRRAVGIGLRACRAHA